MAKRDDAPGDDITGFFLGGLVPLDKVGHVMAALYKSQAGDLQVAPNWAAPVKQRRTAALRNGNQIAALLPAPDDGLLVEERASRDIQRILANAGPTKKNEIGRILHEELGYSASIINGSVLGEMIKNELLTKVSHGVYGLGPKSQATASVQSQAAEAPKPTGKKKKKVVLLHELLAEKGEAGIHYSDVNEVWSKHGYSVSHWDGQPLRELVKKKYAKQITAGHYRITEAGLKHQPAAA